MEDLENRIKALEEGKTYDATKEAVQKVEQECLVKLREIKAAIEAERNGGGATVQSAELDALKAENEALKKANAKLEYRVNHVVSNLEALLDA